MRRIYEENVMVSFDGGVNWECASMWDKVRYKEEEDAQFVKVHFSSYEDLYNYIDTHDVKNCKIQKTIFGKEFVSISSIERDLAQRFTSKSKKVNSLVICLWDKELDLMEYSYNRLKRELPVEEFFQYLADRGFGKI